MYRAQNQLLIRPLGYQRYALYSLLYKVYVGNHFLQRAYFDRLPPMKKLLPPSVPREFFAQFHRASKAHNLL